MVRCPDPWQRMVTVRIGGVKGHLAYSLRPGREQEPGLLLVHGMGSSRHLFARLLARPDLWPGPAAALDLPGFGDSFALPRRQMLDDYVEALLAWMDAAGWDRPFLLGHSFGGMVAARALAGQPGRFRGAVLVSPAGFLPPENVLEPTRWVTWNRVLIWITGSAWWGVRMARFLGLDPGRLDRPTRCALQYGWRRAREMARMGRFYEAPGLLERLAAAGRPAVVLHGTADPIFPWPAMEQELGGRIRLYPLPGLGHLPFLQDPAAFDAALAAVLTELRAGA